MKNTITKVRLLIVVILLSLAVSGCAGGSKATSTPLPADNKAAAANLAQQITSAAVTAQAKPTTPVPTATIASTKSMKANEIVPAMNVSGPLRVNPANPRYFTDGNGKAVYLTGSHTWLNLQDGVLTDPSPAFDYTGFLNFLQANNHNFFRLYVWEEAKWVTEAASPYYFAPLPYERTGPGNALDGKPKFDLTQFNQAYFDRLRQRVIEAGQHGIYVGVMLFNGWSVSYPKGTYKLANPWQGHPYNAANNINGIDGDPANTNSGGEIERLTIPAVTSLQEQYVKKVIDSVNDLDNVLYEICNESNTGPNEIQWQYHLIDFIHNYEATQPKQHPVGMTSTWPNGNDTDLYNSPAEWVSPKDDLGNPSPASGNKVVIADTDHICGICGDRVWVWKSFTRGQNPIFMDQYDDSYKLEGGGYNINNPTDVNLRLNLGYTRLYANRVNLNAMTPHGELSSSGFALANPVASGAEYLTYLPTGGNVTVNLSATAGTLKVEWFNPANGTAISGGTVTGGTTRTFTPPFSGDAVLYLFQ